MNFSFEQGPIRPPSEARSLLIRVTRNCPWNKCAFCHTYHGTKFELRSVEEVKADIQEAGNIADQIREISWKLGQGGVVTRFVIDRIYGSEAFYSDSFRQVAAWLYFGGESVFLQDADSIIVKTGDLVEMIAFIREKFPAVKKITSYCRSHTARRKSIEELCMLRDAGLTRIHIGLESGCDPVLKFIKKGATAADHVEGGQKVVESGISLSEYVIPGLGGDRWSRENALETARVINEINPDYVRMRSLQVRRGTDLYKMMKNGEFKPLGDEDVVREIRLFIENLDGIESRIVSDHILNLLEELGGRLPGDKEKLLGIIDRFFAMPEDDRLIYRLGRRKGIYTKLDDLSDTRTYNMLEAVLEEYRSEGSGNLDRDLYRIMHSYI
ncbi:MAG: radical SAM protein [Thermodesulfobacteriota bacterium]|nr:radical SAM protein [Thermodesulfobacteriota bacterium]